MKISFFYITLITIVLSTGSYILYHSLKTKEMNANTVIVQNKPATSSKNEWINDELSPNERTALVEKSKREPFEKIIPLLLKLLNEYRSLRGSLPSGEAPWNNEKLNSRDRVYLMVSEAWDYQMRPIDDPAKAKFLLSLLQKTSSVSEKYILIDAIKYYQWCSEAELVLFEMLTNSKMHPSLRETLISALLNRCDINIYIPVAIKEILAYKKGQPRCHRFNLINNRNRLFTLNEKNRQLILTTGFEILNDLSEEELRGGYFVASQLGSILAIPGQFSPNQKDLKYQGDSGLTDEFFLDTVRNAIKWYSENKKDMISDFSNKSVKQIIDSMGKPTEILSGFHNYCKSVPI